MDYLQLMFLALIVLFAIAFRLFLPAWFGKSASNRARHHVMAIAGPLGAVAFGLMALSGEPAGWVVAGVMFAAGCLALEKSRRAA